MPKPQDLIILVVVIVVVLFIDRTIIQPVTDKFVGRLKV